VDEHSLSSALASFLTRRSAAPVEVGSIRQLAGGASCRVYSFEARQHGRAPRTLVLRLDADGGAVRSDRREEFVLLAAAARSGVTVPAVHWCGDATEGLGGAFFVMDLVTGEAIARRLLRDERYAQTRAVLPRQLAREAARIHDVDLTAPSLAFLRAREPSGQDPRRYAMAEIDKYRQILAAFSCDHPYPLLQLTARWLEQNAPGVLRPALVHGDYRVGNVMFDERGLTAVLDWELAHVGDAVEDLGWLCVRTWRFGNDDLAAGGLCSREELLAHYREEGGADVEPSHLLFWELFGNWKWAIICRMQAERHKGGKHPDVELAAIGRRLAETEDEILNLLGVGSGLASEHLAEATTGDTQARTAGAASAEIGDTQVRTAGAASAKPGGTPAATAAAPLAIAATPSGILDEPSAIELLEALGAFLKHELAGRLEGSAHFKALVGANVAGIVAREIALRPHHAAAQAQRLASLLQHDVEPHQPRDHDPMARELSFALCRRIEAGHADAGPWREQVLAHLRATVDEKLAIDNPARLGGSRQRP